MSLQNFPSFFLDFSQRDMKGENSHSYGFGRFTLDVSEQRLSDGSSQISLTPKAFDVLSFLVQNAGHLVEKEELMKHVWPDSFVEESNVARIVHTLRRKLGDDGNGNSFIETIPTKGYRFVADVEVIEAPLDERAGENASVDDAVTQNETVEPVEAASPETSAAKSYRRHYFVAGAIVVFGILVTGLWISNGTLMPRAVARYVGHSMNGEAYWNFQEGKVLVEARERENVQKALGKFERAIELDPEYAEAWAGKADAMSATGFGSLQNDDVANAQAALKKALTLDPDSSYAHTIQCRIMGTYYWYFYEAITECQRAVELNPSDPGAHRELGLALNVVGRSDEALSEIGTAIAISPSSNNKRARGLILYMSRHYDEALEQCQQLVATDPDFADGYKWLVLVFAMKNDEHDAFENLVLLELLLQASSEDIDAIRSAYATGGWPAAVRVTLNAPTGIGSSPRYVTAELFAQIGEKDKALDVLDDLRRVRNIMIVNMSRDPMLEPIHDDPRYRSILSEMNLK